MFFSFLQENNPAFCGPDLSDIPVSSLDQVKREDIDGYLDYLSGYERNGHFYTNDNNGKSRKLSVVRCLLHYFHASEIIESNIASNVPLPVRQDKPVVYLNRKEIRELLQQAEEGNAFCGQQRIFYEKTRLRDLAIMTIILGTGVLASELVGLNIGDIDIEDNSFRTHRTGHCDNTIYFGEEVKNALQEYLEQRKAIVPLNGHEDALFLSLQKRRITVRAVEKLVKKYTSLVSDQKVTPQGLRNTCGLNLYSQTGDIDLISDIFGYKNVDTAKKRFGAIDSTRHKALMNSVKLK